MTSSIVDTGREFSKSYRVEDWRPHIERARVCMESATDHPVTSAIPTWAILALIHIESAGDPGADRGDTEYHGLLQIGNAVAEDLGEPSSEVFLGEGERSIRAFFRWADMYWSRLHSNASEATADLDCLAVGWKAGVGTVARFKSRREAGESTGEILRWLNADRWGAGKYLVNFWKASEVYQ